MTAKRKHWVEKEGAYIQTPESTSFSGIDPRKDRDKLRRILAERFKSVPIGLKTIWSFRYKGEKRTIAQIKPETKAIKRWEKIMLGDIEHVVVDIEVRQIDGSSYVREHIVEKFDPAKHKIDDRTKY